MAKLIVGVNDLATLHPELISEWNAQKNDELDPSSITCGSNRRVWWICNKGHEWQATISERTRKRPSGCPYCAHKRAILGVNDLVTTHPELLQEWDYEKNKDLHPQTLIEGSNKSVWWKCVRCGHEWKATVASRTKGSGCPECSSGVGTSFQEQTIYFYIKKIFPDAINGYSPEWEKSKYEFDIYIPKLNLGIEYDGQRWHQNSSKDAKKTAWAIRNGAKLIRVREPKCPLLQDGSYQVLITKLDSNYIYLEKAIESVFEIISELYGIDCLTTINVQNDFQQILATYEKSKHNESLLAVNPVVARAWDYKKNAFLTPDRVTAHTSKRVWWFCDTCGQSSLQSVASRVSGVGCPYCSGKKVLKGFNDLETVAPTLAKEWNQKMNGALRPSEVTQSARKAVWWTCRKCGYEWRAAIYSRSSGVGCPACAKKVVWVGHNDLATTNPQLAKEWDYERNKPITPEEVTNGTHQKFWWICATCGHNWKTSVVGRGRGSGCPKCAIDTMRTKSQRQNLILGETDLSSTHPELVSEWDQVKNSPLTPQDVTAGSGLKVWWICNECGHKWSAVIQTRTAGGGCPECRRKKMAVFIKKRSLKQGVNDLASVAPELLGEWDFERNQSMDPTTVTAGSASKAWWICKTCGYKWKAIIANRVRGVGCPVCANKTVWAGHNDLATTNPDLLEEWDYERNSPLLPQEFTVGSGKRVWWKCKECGYEWQTSVSHKRGCPACSNRAVWQGHNDLKTTNPELVEEWDKEKNLPLTVETVTAGSGKRVWWKCKECGFEWQARIVDKGQGARCPNCTNIPIERKDNDGKNT